MFRPRRRLARKLAAWSAALAFALSGSAPLAAKARPGLPPGLHDLCTTDGAKRSPGESVPHSHCALCAVRADAAALAPHFTAALLAVSDFRHEVPRVSCRILSAFRSLPPAPPRAPPLYS
jgi:hypothetical protein